MLTLTTAAVEAVNAVAGASGLPDTAGLRIASTTEAGPPGALTVEVVSGPAEHDEVLDTGAPVFLEPDAAAYLADKELNAQLDEQGQVHFALGPQDSGAGTPPA
jgi:iron-sulfur cluster assembly protein